MMFAYLKRVLALSMMVPTVSSCAWISTYVPAPDVQIEAISNQTGRVVSAGFWRDGSQLSLRGEVAANPVSKSILRGHLDIEVVDSTGTEVVCLIAKPRMRPRQVHKPYSVKLRTLPEPGSTVRIRHHLDLRHEGCAVGGDRLLSTPSLENGAAISGKTAWN